MERHLDIHVNGNPPSVVTVSIALDRERIALREALGYTSHHWPLEDLYSRVGETFYGVISRDRIERQSVWREKLDFHHRYVTEDVGCGLALWASLGRRLGVPTPLADVFLTLASTVNGEDSAATGRTLENLGLGGCPSPSCRRAPHGMTAFGVQLHGTFPMRRTSSSHGRSSRCRSTS